jgi:hypothetical protein
MWSAQGHSILALVESAHFRTSPGCFCPGPVQVFRRKCELPWSPLFTQGEFEQPPRTGTSYQLARRFAVARGSQALRICCRQPRLLHSHLGSVYRCGPIVLGMVPTAQKHLEVTDLYEQSADENASIEWRIAFARKAKWHRILARTSAEKEHPLAKENASDAEQVLRSETSLFSPTRLWEARDRTELAKTEANSFGGAKQRVPGRLIP